MTLLAPGLPMFFRRRTTTSTWQLVHGGMAGSYASGYHTYAGLNFDAPPANDRVLVVCTTTRETGVSGGSGANIISVTIGGVSAIRAAGNTASQLTTSRDPDGGIPNDIYTYISTAIYYAVVPNGTSGDVRIRAGGDTVRMSLLAGYSSGLLDAGSAGSSWMYNIATAVGGGVIAVGRSFSSAPTSGGGNAGVGAMDRVVNSSNHAVFLADDPPAGTSEDFQFSPADVQAIASFNP